MSNFSILPKKAQKSVRKHVDKNWHTSHRRNQYELSKNQYLYFHLNGPWLVPAVLMSLPCTDPRNRPQQHAPYTLFCYKNRENFLIFVYLCHITVICDLSFYCEVNSFYSENMNI